MSYQTIEVHNSTPHIGAEIRGVDLSNPLGNQQFQEVHHALMDRLVIFFRDQKLGIEQHKDFARRFGKLHMHPASPNVIADHPEVLVIKADDSPGIGSHWSVNRRLISRLTASGSGAALRNSSGSWREYPLTS